MTVMRDLIEIQYFTDQLTYGLSKSNLTMDWGEDNNIIEIWEKKVRVATLMFKFEDEFLSIEVITALLNKLNAFDKIVINQLKLDTELNNAFDTRKIFLIDEVVYAKNRFTYRTKDTFQKQSVIDVLHELQMNIRLMSILQFKFDEYLVLQSN